jgi:hypothetical protein
MLREVGHYLVHVYPLARTVQEQIKEELGVSV